MRLTRLCLTVLLALLTLTDHLRAAEPDDFQPMFNGKDLSGWVLTNTPPETWTFQDGMLVCTGRPTGEIRTEKMYQNFIMELEWRHMVPRGNAGIFVWADDIPARGVPFHRGIEVQVLENAYGNTRSHTTHGDIFPIHGARMTPINGHGGSRAFPTEHRSRPSPEWNHYRIECRDGQISLAVNGKTVTRGKDCSPRKGYICLESEGGVVHYRNVRIRVLPDSKVDPADVAIADRGYRSLYTGLNLNGWDTDGRSDAWKASDWQLVCEPRAGHSAKLITTKAFAQPGFIVDVRLNAPESRVVLTDGLLTVDLNGETVRPHLEKPGRWNRIEIDAAQGRRTLTVNGERVPVDAAVPAHAKLQLSVEGPATFCNLFVRRLHQ